MYNHCNWYLCDYFGF